MCAVSAFNRDNHYTRHTEKAPHSRETWAKQRYVVEGPYTETEMVCVLTASRMNVFGWLWDVAFFVLPELCSYYCSRFFFRRLSSLNVAFGLFWTLRYCRVAGLCCFFLSICILSVDAQTFSVCVCVCAGFCIEKCEARQLDRTKAPLYSTIDRETITSSKTPPADWMRMCLCMRAFCILCITF